MVPETGENRMLFFVIRYTLYAGMNSSRHSAVEL